jgi:hypothetical protein
MALIGFRSRLIKYEMKVHSGDVNVENPFIELVQAHQRLRSTMDQQQIYFESP